MAADLAYDHPTFLLAALGVGIAGGSFAVGITYVSRWYEQGKQGTALGVRRRHVGAAVTKFVAPFVMVAWGWKSVAEIWSIVLLATAVVFWFTTRTIRSSPPGARRASSPSRSGDARALRNVQVWRFSLYYFFCLRRLRRARRCGCRAI